MTNEDKRDLRSYVRQWGSKQDKRIARIIGCAVSTVKKYRKAIEGAKP